jgi:DNA-binding transcriptional ArsR family regulator
MRRPGFLGVLPSRLLAASLAGLLAVSLVPLTGAALDPLETLRETASEAHPVGAWIVDETGKHDDGGEDEPADEEAPSGDGSGAQGGSGGQGAPRPLGARPTAFVFAVVHEVAQTLPEDPLAFLDDQVDPVEEAAASLQSTLLPGAEPETSPPAPASASANRVEPAGAMPLLVASTAAAAAAVAVLWLAGSSGSLGAGAAGAAGTGGKLAGTDLRRLLPFASPLFTRFEKDTVLGHPKREALYALILQDPGVSLQSLCDSTGLSRTAVTHHLRLMELQHLVVSKRMGRNRHYFENGGRFGRDQKDAYAVLQNDRSREVADFVRRNPGAIQKAICAAVGVQPSVAHWHLRRLLEAQLVESVRNGRTVSYYPGAGLKAVPGPVSAPLAAAAPPMPLSA